MNIIVKENNYKVKFGYLVVAKSGIITKVIDAIVKVSNDDTDISNLMVTLAELLLCGLQKAHSDEFGYNFITDEGKEEKLEKVCDLLDDYFDEDNDPVELFESLTEELMRNGFLGKILAEEKSKNEKKSAKK